MQLEIFGKALLLVFFLSMSFFLDGCAPLFDEVGEQYDEIRKGLAEQREYARQHGWLKAFKKAGQEMDDSGQMVAEQNRRMKKEHQKFMARSRSMMRNNRLGGWNP